MNINIEGKSRAKVLAALYNNSKPLGMGILHWTPEPMTESQAQEMLDDKRDPVWFDYVNGRVMKIGFQGNEVLRCDLYDRDLGKGAAERVIKSV